MHAARDFPNFRRLAREFDGPRLAYPLPWLRERQLRGAETVPAQPMPA